MLVRAPINRSSLATIDAKIPMVDRLAAVNLFLALFNMIPAFPMDGGRVLRALLAIRLGFVRATEIAASIGQGRIHNSACFGLFGKPDADLHRDLRLSGGASEAQLVALRAVSRDVPVTGRDDDAIRPCARRPYRRRGRALLRTSQSGVSGGRCRGDRSASSPAPT